jgi:hypothetical protein
VHPARSGIVLLYSPIFSAILHSGLIAKSGNFCLYPERNNLTGKEAKRRGPMPNHAVWTDKDFKSIYPITPDKLEYYAEYPVKNFMLNGCVGKNTNISINKQFKQTNP